MCTEHLFDILKSFGLAPSDVSLNNGENLCDELAGQLYHFGGRFEERYRNTYLFHMLTISNDLLGKFTENEPTVRFRSVNFYNLDSAMKEDAKYLVGLHGINSANNVRKADCDKMQEMVEKGLGWYFLSEGILDYNLGGLTILIRNDIARIYYWRKEYTEFSKDLYMINTL